MAHFHFRIRDRFNRILAESDIEEIDRLAACRAVAVALSLFSFSEGGRHDASIELNDDVGQLVARISLKVET